jgi:hypothetical protein
MGGLVTTTVVGVHAAGAATVSVSGRTKASTLDTPDPAVVYSGSGNKYYAYSTGIADSATATYRATATINFTPLACTSTGCAVTGIAHPEVISPTKVPRTVNLAYGFQAPSVAYLGGQWVMYYAAFYVPNGNPYAIYYATSSQATTGFTTPAAETTPLTLQATRGGAADPSVFITPSGNPWLTWKTSTYPSSPYPAQIWSKRLATSGLHLTTGATAYVLATQPGSGWDSATIENPQMVWSGGTYYLFFSGGNWNSVNYGEGYVTCSGGPTGGCGSASSAPEILSGTTSAPYGPGGASLFTSTTGQWLMAYHGWNEQCAHYATIFNPCGASRQLYVNQASGLFSTSLPNVTSFTASASTLSFTGGTVTLTAQATRAVTYMFTASPGITGLPAAVNTTSGTARVTVDLPHNGSSTAKTYTFTVTATGPYGGQATKSVNVVVNPAPPVNATSSPLALNPSNDSLDAVVQGPSGSLYAYKATAGAGWSGTSIAGSGNTAPAAVAYNPANGSQDAVVEGTGGQLDYYYRLTNTGPWYSGGAFGSNDEGTPAMVYNPANATLNIVVQTSSGLLQSYYRTTTGGSWYGPYVLNATATATGAPAVVYNPVNQTINVVAQAPSGRLESYYASAGTRWAGPYYFGTGVTGPPSLVYNPLNGTVDVVVQGTSGELQSYYAGIGTTWSGASTFAAHSATGAPVAAMNTVNGRLTVVVQCSGGQLESFYVTSGSAWSGPSRFGATVVGAPSLAFNALNSSMNVIAPRSNGDEYSFYVAGTNPWGGPYLMGPT